MSEDHRSFIDAFNEQLEEFLTDKLSEEDLEHVTSWADRKIRKSFSNGIEVGKKRAYKDAKKKGAKKSKSSDEESDDLLG